ncbi:hypothetical protein EJ110_NYTH11261 [Nymphaea thermarum]|nr:hypothetical protein EJ110_NYTH11261 [Nymphaea thermarum]
MADGDFDEDEVWSVIGHREKWEGGCRSKKSGDATTPKRAAYGASRMIPRSGGTANSPEARTFQQSAPVNIPDWSKVYKNAVITSWDFGCDDDGGGGGGHGFEDDGHYRGSLNDGSDDDDEDDDRVPPHELIAKKLARSHITTSSVYEGAGRTLKGRDLSKVRNAVLTSTGFLE